MRRRGILRSLSAKELFRGLGYMPLAWKANQEMRHRDLMVQANARITAGLELLSEAIVRVVDTSLREGREAFTEHLRERRDGEGIS